MTGSGNRTYLLAGGSGPATLVDAGVGAARHLDDLDEALEQSGASLANLVVTHAHGDHISGAPSIRARHPEVRCLKHPWPSEDAHVGITWEPLQDGARIAAGGEELVVLHTPGHSPDHIALWHETSGTILSGDLVTAGSSVAILASRGGNLRQYLDALERLRQLKPTRLLPAHGPDIDAPELLLAHYVAHRLMRERQVVQALSHGHRTISAITESIYDDLSPALRLAAQENVRAHIEKLRDEGRIAGAEGQEFTLL